MNIITTCIGDLPEELREATINKQRERRKNGNIYYPFLSDECVESLKDEVMLTIWPMEHGFIFILINQSACTSLYAFYSEYQ